MRQGKQFTMAEKRAFDLSFKGRHQIPKRPNYQETIANDHPVANRYN
jgi:hypothetical protein